MEAFLNQHTFNHLDEVSEKSVSIRLGIFVPSNARNKLLLRKEKVSMIGSSYGQLGYFLSNCMRSHSRKNLAVNFECYPYYFQSLKGFLSCDSPA